jgi:RNA polymerase sigma-70 factor (ECF subfamily)
MTAPHEDSLTSLARAAARGDRSVMRPLLVAVTPTVAGMVQRVLGSRDADCDDVAQEALVALLHALPRFRFECSVHHFARRVALRTATTALRNRRAARRFTKTRVVDITEEDVVVESPDDQPLDAAIGKRRLELLRELIAELPNVQAEAVALKVMLGCSVKEIADETNANVNTVRSRLQIAKDALRTRIADDGRFAELREEVAP